MKNKSDSILVENVQNGCSESLQELINRHSNLFFDMCSKYVKKTDCLNYQDLIEDVSGVIYEAARTYKNDKGAKFSTWLGHMSRFHCLNTIKFRAGLVFAPNEDLDIYMSKKNKFHIDKKEHLSEYIDDILLQLKDKRIVDIFKLRFSDKHKKVSWHIIAKKMDLSTTHCINLFEKGRKLLYNKIYSEKLFDKT